jgi:Zn-dependent protease
MLPPMLDRRESFYLGHLGPIPLYAHWSFIFLLWMALGFANPTESASQIPHVLAYLIVLLSGILLHEMGHGMAARAQGALGVTITLWAFGGLCSSTRDSLPRREIIILAAGPAVSFLLAWGGYLAIQLLAASTPGLLVSDPNDVAVLEYLRDHDPDKMHYLLMGKGSLLGESLALCYRVNLVLGIFNIMPIFPLDGGQIVFNVARLFARDQVAAKFSLGLAVVVAIGFFAWRTYQSQQFDTYLAILLIFLLFNAFRSLR